MVMQSQYPSLSCAACATGAGLDFDFTMAFQPIVDTRRKEIYAYEALVRGMSNESAGSILARVDEKTRYRFDQACRVKAIHLAAQLGLRSRLHINFLPNAVYHATTCIRTTLEAASVFNIPVRHITFEVTEGERVEDHHHLLNIIHEYKQLGFKTAIDDFGAGYAGLNLLAQFQPDIVKLDMVLTRNIDTDKNKQAIVSGIIHMCNTLGIDMIAEGVETYEELMTLRDAGISLFQGYYFARPAFQALVSVSPATLNR